MCLQILLQLMFCSKGDTTSQPKVWLYMRACSLTKINMYGNASHLFVESMNATFTPEEHIWKDVCNFDRKTSLILSDIHLRQVPHSLLSIHSSFHWLRWIQGWWWPSDWQRGLCWRFSLHERKSYLIPFPVNTMSLHDCCSSFPFVSSIESFVHERRKSFLTSFSVDSIPCWNEKDPSLYQMWHNFYECLYCKRKFDNIQELCLPLCRLWTGIPLFYLIIVNKRASTIVAAGTVLPRISIVSHFILLPIFYVKNCATCATNVYVLSSTHESV